jgi:hypothetical protein
MDKQEIIESIGYCGLVCKLCHLADECGGCKSNSNICAKHLSEAGCFQLDCCVEKRINGCWECDDFPCENDMYSHDSDAKVKAFARCIREDGVETFIEYILENQKSGLDIREGKDYDNRTEEEVLHLLRNGKYLRGKDL